MGDFAGFLQQRITQLPRHCLTRIIYLKPFTFASLLIVGATLHLYSISPLLIVNSLVSTTCPYTHGEKRFAGLANRIVDKELTNFFAGPTRPYLPQKPLYRITKRVCWES